MDHRRVDLPGGQPLVPIHDRRRRLPGELAGQPTCPVQPAFVPGGHLLGPWWALWLGSLLLDRIVTNIWDNADSPDSLRTAGLVELMQSATTLGAAATVILIVRQISTWQDGRAGQTA